VRGRALTLRAVALLAAGSAAVHQLRYAIGYGHDARHELATQGHAYLAVMLPFAAALAVVALASMLRGGLADPGRGPRRRRSLGRTALIAFAALACVYVGQELLEGALAGAHPDGVAAVVGDDGWVALLLAAPVSGLVALGLRADEALAREWTRARPLPLESLPIRAGARIRRVPPAARIALAARGPPVAG
jgi:hypothetical protein